MNFFLSLWMLLYSLVSWKQTKYLNTCFKILVIWNNFSSDDGLAVGVTRKVEQCLRVCDPAGSESGQIQSQPCDRPSTKYLQIFVYADARPVGGNMAQVWLLSTFDKDRHRTVKLNPPHSSLVRFNTCTTKSFFFVRCSNTQVTSKYNRVYLVSHLAVNGITSGYE